MITVARAISRSGVAVIRGCSIGISRATVAVLATAGHDVVATARARKRWQGSPLWRWG
jgi:NADP-dependent 3-hydroxy acid dehydrogenase YdfG